jgi:hypothetical protein
MSNEQLVGHAALISQMLMTRMTQIEIGHATLKTQNSKNSAPLRLCV